MSTTVAERVPVSVLTGFLGSGKTTLLRALLRKPDMGDTAVIINEFGEVGLDHLLVEKSNDDGMIELSSGCLCCTVRGDLVRVMSDLSRKRRRGEINAFKRLVVETTGLADPAPILHTLMTDPLLSTSYRLDGVVTTVDAVNGAATLDNHMESVKQAAVADRLLLTKADIAEPSDVDDLRARLRTLNPGARLLTIRNGDAEPGDIMNAGLYNPDTKTTDVRRWLQDEAYLADPHHHHHHHHHSDDHGHHHHAYERGHRHGHDEPPAGDARTPFAGPGPEHYAREQDAHDVNRHDARIRAFCLTFDTPFAWATVVGALDALVVLRGSDLLRVKGILNVAEVATPVVIHGVQHVFHPPAVLERWPDEDRRSKIVFITRDIAEAAVRRILKPFIDGADQWTST